MDATPLPRTFKGLRDLLIKGNASRELVEDVAALAYTAVVCFESKTAHRLPVKFRNEARSAYDEQINSLVYPDLSCYSHLRRSP